MGHQVVRHGPSALTDGLSYWGIRLLGPNSELLWLNTSVYPDEHGAFIKVYRS
jgi:hypothetical protein